MHGTTKIDGLVKRLSRISNAFGGVDVHQLDDEQLLIRKNMVSNITANKRAKSAALIPGDEGYECYV